MGALIKVHVDLSVQVHPPVLNHFHIGHYHK